MLSPVQITGIKISYLKLKIVLVSGSHLQPMNRFLFSVWRLRPSWCGPPSLTRVWIRNLLVQLLLGLTRAITLGSRSRRTHDHILLSHLRHSYIEGQVVDVISSKNREAKIYPKALGSFCRLLRLAGLRWRYSNPPPPWSCVGLHISNATKRIVIVSTIIRDNFF
jgi:hypothetical protein